MASKVRVKLARQSADPKSSLRLLVLQANMLDRLMDDITINASKAKAPSKVTFTIPQKAKEQEIHRTTGGPNVTEYEVDSDSDSDSDEEDYIYNASSDSEEDDYDPEDDEYLSDSDDELFMKDELRLTSSNNLRVIDLSDDRQLPIVFEESEEEMPELQGLNITSSDSESDDEIHMPNYVLSSTSSPYLEGLSKERKNMSVDNISLQDQESTVNFNVENVY